MNNILFSMKAQEQDNSFNGGESTKYPENTKPLENQVAGHSFSDDCCTIGMLRDEEGYVLKPVNKPEQGRREIQFYESLMISTSKDLLKLKQFVPEYFGSVTFSINGRCARFLKLMDATRGYQKPCVMDVKIGKQTWEPGAPEAKQRREETKYTLCKQQCGFCIPGFQVYNITSGMVEKYGKDYGKKLKREEIPEVLKKFLNSESKGSRIVAEEVLNQLNSILAWSREQRQIHMYSSSILLTYDAQVLAPPSIDPLKMSGASNDSHQVNQDDTTALNKMLTSRVRVILIDFAHVLPANGYPDNNYLFGLETLVQIFTSLLNEL